MEKILIVGAGIAGLAFAKQLSTFLQQALFDKNKLLKTEMVSFYNLR